MYCVVDELKNIDGKTFKYYINLYDASNLLINKYIINENENEFFISAKQRIGLAELKKALLEIAGWQPESEGLIFARKRHIEALLEAQEFISDAKKMLEEGVTLDLAAEEMRLAQEALSRITGEFLPDDLLGKIFSTFCIGK